MADTPEPSSAEDAAGPIVARGGLEYRLKRLALVLLLVGYGALSIRDGFFVYPRENAQAVRDHPGIAKLPHAPYDAPLNKLFGVTLPPLGLLLLAWSLYNSRGRFTLGDDDVLHAPGHPPVPLAAVTAVDRGKWDRKGIALVDYTLPDGRAGRLKLDDFVYQRQPTDRIFDRVMAAVETPAELPELPVDVPVGGPDVASGDPTRRL